MSDTGSNNTQAQIKTEPPVEACISEPTAHIQHVCFRHHQSLSYSYTSHDRTEYFPQSSALQQSQTEQPPQYSPANPVKTGGAKWPAE